MGVYTPPQLTPAGELLMAKAQTGVELKFTRVTVGDGIVAPQEIALTTPPTVESGWARLDVRFTNESETIFQVRLIQVWANDPDVGEIAYSEARSVTQGGVDMGSWIPGSTSSSPYQATFTIYSKVDNAANVTAIIGDMSYVTWPQLEEALNPVRDSLNNHIIDPMPHRFTDGPDTYKYGFGAVDGVVVFKYEVMT